MEPLPRREVNYTDVSYSHHHLKGIDNQGYRSRALLSVPEGNNVSETLAEKDDGLKNKEVSNSSGKSSPIIHYKL